MSWSFRKVGTDKAALKAAIQAEHAPAEVKVRVCEQIDALNVLPGQAIVVMSSGHHESPQPQPSWGESAEKTTVHLLPLINTPVGSGG